MITSSEVSNIFATQNQQFLNQQSYANNIGVAAPQINLGSPFPRGPIFDQNQYRGSFSYERPESLGYGYGSGLGGRVTGLGMGAAGLAASSVFNPITFGMAGYGVAGVAGAVGVGAVGLGAGMLAAAPFAMMGHGSRQHGQIERQLGQYQFFNPASRTGTGFSREDALGIRNKMADLAHVPGMLTSMEELMGLLPKLKQTGMMHGAQDAAEFSRRFKEAVTTIRDVSKVLGTTMEQAADFFQHSRSVGFLGKRDQLQNALNVQFTSGTTGMPIGQVMQMQATGSAMATQMGVKRAAGAKAITKLATSLGQAVKEGHIEEGALEDMTGASNPEEAISMAAPQFLQMMAGIGRNTAAGRFMMIGMSRMDGGKISLDEDIARKVRSKEMSMSELRSRGMRMASQRGVAIAFKAHEDALSMEFSEKVGPGGFGSFVRDIAEQHGYKGDDASLLLMKKFGINETTGKVISGMSDRISSSEDDKATMNKVLTRNIVRSERSPEAILRRVRTRTIGALSSGFEQKGAEIRTAISSAVDDFLDEITGNYTLTLSKEGLEEFSRAMSSGRSRNDVKDLVRSSFGQVGPNMSRGLGSRLGEFFRGSTDYGVATGAAAGIGGTIMGAIGGGIKGFALGGLPGMAVGAIGGGVVAGSASLLAGTSIGNLFGGELIGKDPITQGNYLRSSLGLDKGSGQAQVDAKVKELRLKFSSDRSTGSQSSVLRYAINNIASGISGFSSMSQAEKIKAIKDKMPSTVTTEQIIGASSHLLGDGLDLQSGAADHFETIKRAAENYNAVKRSVSSQLGGDVNAIAAVEKGSTTKLAGLLIDSVTNMDRGTHSDLKEILLSSASDAEKAERINKEIISKLRKEDGSLSDIKTADVANLTAFNKQASNKDRASLETLRKDSINLFKTRIGNDTFAIMKAIGSASDSVSDKDLKKSMIDFSTTPDEGALRSGVQKFMEKMDSFTSEKERAEFARTGGRIGLKLFNEKRNIDAEIDRNVVVGKRVSKEQLMSYTGATSDEELAASLKDIKGFEIGGKANEALRTRLKQNVRVSSATAGSVKGAEEHSLEKQLVQVLTTLNETNNKLLHELQGSSFFPDWGKGSSGTSGNTPTETKNMTPMNGAPQ